MRKAVFLHSDKLQEYRYPAEHPFNTTRAANTRKILNSMGLLTGAGRSEIAPEPTERVVLKKFHTAQYLHALKTAVKKRWNSKAMDMGLGTSDCPVFEGLYDYSVLACGAVQENRAVCGLSGQLEQARPWSNKRAPVHAGKMGSDSN